MADVILKNVSEKLLKWLKEEKKVGRLPLSVSEDWKKAKIIHTPEEDGVYWIVLKKADGKRLAFWAGDGWREASSMKDGAGLALLDEEVLEFEGPLMVRPADWPKPGEASSRWIHLEDREDGDEAKVAQLRNAIFKVWRDWEGSEISEFLKNLCRRFGGFTVEVDDDSELEDNDGGFEGSDIE